MIVKISDYDSVFEVIYRSKERDRRLQMADSRVLVVIVFGRGSRLPCDCAHDASANQNPSLVAIAPVTLLEMLALCLCLLYRAKAVLENAGKEVLGRASWAASFACIFMLIPLFRPTSIPFYTLSTQILAK